MNVVFMGTPNFSVRILEAVHNEYGVNLVVSQPDKFVGRKKVLTFSPVKEKAVELGIEVFQPINIKNDFEKVLEIKPDIIITAAYGQMIPDEIIDYPRLGCINVHGSYLPLLRGGAPIQRAIKRLYNTTGVSIMYMAYKMDSGDLISQRAIPIMPNYTSGVLFEKLSVLGRDLLMETLPSIIEGTNSRTPQKEHMVTYAYNLTREEEKINWGLSMAEIDAHVRSFSPEPGCYTTIDGKSLKILSVEMFPCENFEEIHSKDPNGLIVKVFKREIGVKCLNGVIKVTAVQLEGKTKQRVKDFLNGSGRNLIAEQKQFK